MVATQEKKQSSVNEVRLVGRLSAVPIERELPSGDVLGAFSLVVERTRPKTTSPQGHVSRQRVDVVECVAWRPALLRSVKGWGAGDLVEISGAVRRRFFQTPGGAASRYEIEVERGRILRRAAT